MAGRTVYRLLFLFVGLCLSVSLAQAQTGFIITWNTENPGVSNNTSIVIPTNPSYGYNYDVDWDNDGVYDRRSASGTLSHDFGAPGIYTIRIRGTFPHIYFANGGDKEKLIEVRQWGDIAWSSFEEAFHGCKNLTVTATDAPDLSGVTSLHAAFKECDLLNTGFNNWDVSTITDMSMVFQGCDLYNQSFSNWDVRNVTTFSFAFSSMPEFDRDLSGWDLSSATNLSYMFAHTPAYNRSMDDWEVAQVTNMAFMFQGATAFNQDLSRWDVSSVAEFRYMFHGATAFNQDISGWNTSNANTMDGMFRDASSFNQPVAGWDVSQITDFSYLFSGASAFDQDLSTWDVSQGRDFTAMFFNAHSFNQDINTWDVARATEMSQLFHQAYAFNQPLDSWDVGAVSNMSQMFHGATAFNQSLNAWDVSQVTDMSLMFASTEVFHQDLDQWDVGRVTDMRAMFSRAEAFSGEIFTWDVRRVKDFSFMFYQAKAFNAQLADWNPIRGTTFESMFEEALVFDQNINRWDVSSVVTMASMFQNARAFNQPLNNWNTKNVQSTSNMFMAAWAFNQPLEDWDLAADTTLEGMFGQTKAFNQDLSTWNTGRVNSMANMFARAEAFDQNLGDWDLGRVQTMENMFDNHGLGLSTANYDSTLMGWASRTVQTGVVLDMPKSTYCLGSAARDTLAIANGWVINDSGSGSMGPTALCRDTTIFLTLAGEATLSSTLLDAGSFDSCGTITSHPSQTLFTCVDLGDQLVTLTVVNQSGDSATCTSTVTVQDSVYIDTVVACDSYTWINGITYTTDVSGINHSYSAANGCTVTEQLYLTILPTYRTRDAVSACAPYRWIDGRDYTASTNTPTVTFQTSQGCDSVVWLDLTILPSDTVVDRIVTCTPYTWIDGVTYSDDNETASVTLTNQYGCDSVVQLDLLYIGGPKLSLASSDVSCFGKSDGSISVGITGGKGPYTVLWADIPTQNVTHRSGLAADNYSVAVMDTEGCLTQENVAVLQPVPLSGEISGTLNCIGGTDGQLMVATYGGTGPYQFAWQIPGTTDTLSTSSVLTPIPEGTYQVNIQDAQGCDLSVVESLTASDSIPIAPENLEVYHLDCDSLILTWDPVVSAENYILEKSLSADFSLLIGQWSLSDTLFRETTTYDETSYWRVQAENGCSVSDHSNVLLTEAPTEALCTLNCASFEVSMLTVNSTSCAGISDGSITVFLAAENTSSINQWAVLGINSQDTLWQPLPHSIGSMEGLPAGRYQVLVRHPSADGTCLAPASLVEIASQAPTISASTSIEVVDCTGENSFSLEPTGGSGVYNLLIQKGETIINSLEITSSVTLESLEAGEYHWLLRDGSELETGCLLDGAFTMPDTEPQLLSTETTIIHAPICSGDSSGVVLVEVTGGSGTYQFSRDGSFSEDDLTNGLIRGLPPGVSSVHIRDVTSSECQTTVFFVIPEPEAITPEGLFEVLQPASCDLPTGIVQIPTFSGGSLPYTYFFDGAQITLPEEGQISGISAGNHVFTVIDDNGCNQAFGVVVEAIEEPSVTLIPLPITDCESSSGAALVLPTQPGLEYGYSFLPGGPYTPLEAGDSLIIRDIPFGQHPVFLALRLSDGTYGCSAQYLVDVGGFAPLSMQTTVVDASCHGASEGHLLLSSITGYQGHSDTVWVRLFKRNQMLQKYQVTSDNLAFILLHPGVYRLQLSRDGSCPAMVETEVAVDQPEIFSFTGENSGIRMRGEPQTGQERTVTLHIYGLTGGTPPYFLDISGPSYEVAGHPIAEPFGLGPYQTHLTGVPAGSYPLRFYDVHGCEFFDELEVPEFSDLVIPNAFSPNEDGYNDTFTVSNLWMLNTEYPAMEYELIVLNRWGQTLFQIENFEQSQNGWDGYLASSGQRAFAEEGVYFIQIRPTKSWQVDNPGAEYQTYRGVLELLK
ncbi:MAG TPA: hypothetical protein DCP28_34275 [Cytophagales bacterium]|nr:hypothetical protein [Cytophagales bacterium]